MYLIGTHISVSGNRTEMLICMGARLYTLRACSLGLLQLERFRQQQAIQQILAGETKIKTVSLVELGISVFLPDTEISHLSHVTLSKKPTSRDRCLSSIVLYLLLTKFAVLVKLSSVHTTMLLWSSPEPWFKLTNQTTHLIVQLLLQAHHPTLTKPPPPPLKSMHQQRQRQPKPLSLRC
ncbi:uncharacterized protein F5891DRAFT_976257 [Suillus fuscotomentosus]|uniref:Uncharacterized protein n=1 Tax=Suillus fuscotomentosus TaxID=1912939 RepID=A0AAD4EFH4_9AGAM|nr:uncharacterized protein F5891DRAFT_976257 [Suillus fuscotomentosus]KAG1905303.1 hypothetical protein F5891DRAFT_976257 [Suillus fuscotomentosus]